MGTTLRMENITVILDSELEIEIQEKYPEGSSKYCWKVLYEHSGLVKRQAVLKFLKPNVEGISWRNLHDEAVRIQALRDSGLDGIEDILLVGKCHVQREGVDVYESEYVITRFLPYTETLGAMFQVNEGNYGLQFVLTLMAKILSVIKACHEANCIHLDLHPNNILIKITDDTETQMPICEQAVVIDFGLARDIPSPVRIEGGDYRGNIDQKAAVVGGYNSFLHPDLMEYLKANQNVPSEVIHSPDARRFDLYGVSRCIEVVLNLARIDAGEELTKQSLQVVLTQLRNVGQTVTYSIDRALGAIELNKALLEKPSKIRLAGESNVTVHSRFVKIIDSVQIQRLRKVYQLGFTHLVYPSATHSRYSHSIGVFELANQYIDALQNNSEIFRGMFNNADLELLRTAALIHDIGHYPFAHYFEELLNKDKIVPRNNEGFPDAIKLHHEYKGTEILKGELKIGSDADYMMFTSAIGRITKESDLKSVEKFFSSKSDRYRLLRAIISGPIDCDKVDYLSRDGHSCGVPYSQSIDVSRLLSSLTVCYDDETEDPKYILALSPKGLAPVESILNARYHMFSEVYWHKACRGIAALLKYALYLLISNGLTQEEFDRAVFADDDWYVLSWLDSKLRNLGLLQQADELIKYPLLECRRSEMYSRIVTYSAIWDGRKSDIWVTLSKISENRDYGSIIDVSRKLMSALNAELSEKFSKADLPPLVEHQVLIDVPPADEKTHKYPHIFYPEAKNKRHVLPLNDVSGIHTTNARFEKSPLELTHKIRIFIARPYASIVKENWSNAQDLGRHVSNLMRNSLGI